LGVISRTQKRLADAQTEFLTAIRLNPANSKAFGNLGFVYLALGNIDAAEANLAQALKLNPADDLARSTLQEIRQKRPHSPAQSKN
jgi:Flp pilus assembly protein TadD